MEEEITIIEPIRYAQFTTIEAYNAVNIAIAAWKDQQTNGEYSRTDTSYEYNHEPEPNWDGMYYMPAEPKLVEAGLFEGITLLDSVPVEPIEVNPDSSWTNAEIQEWLTNNGIKWTTSLNKAGLLALVP